MKRILLFLVALSTIYAGFQLESLEFKISNIQKDGSATVQENIKLLVLGNSSKDLYDSGYVGNNTLSFWSAHTRLKEVKQHVNTAKVVIRDFTVEPQAKTGCNPFLNLCHGELKLTYNIFPIYNITNGKLSAVNGTGLFIISKYKPRTTRYSLNVNALNFPTTGQGNILLNDNVYVSVNLPGKSRIGKKGDVAPLPKEFKQNIPGYVKELTWNDMILAKFTLIFEVEETLDKEVTDFFSNSLANFQSAVQSQHGMSLIVVIAILIGSYVYVNIAKKKREE